MCRWRCRRADPEAPTGVRLHRLDGTVINCELVYEGVVDGLHRWTIAGVTYQPGDEVSIDVLPGRTSIGFEVRTNP